MKLFDPDTIAKPASQYSHGVLVSAHATRLIISGQVGINPDGTIAEALEAQMQRCWDNLFEVLYEAGMTKTNLIKITVYVTQPGVTSHYRKMRDEVLEGHKCAATYVVVKELALPELLVEIEGEAVAEN